MSLTFVSVPPLPRAAQRTTSVTTRPVMVARDEVKTSRRAFTAAALAATVGVVLPKAASAQTTAKQLAPPSTVPKTPQDPVKLATTLVESIIGADPTIAATLLRLAFHDSFTFDPKSKKGGANGSIRLELKRPENAGLARAVEALTPVQAKTGLSWGDTIALAGAVAVRVTGGPNIPVKLGRGTAKSGDPGGFLPNSAENVDQLRQRFAPRGFDDRDLVALSGAHTLGKVTGGGPFVKDSTKFQNDYFKNLVWFQERKEKRLPTDGGPPNRPNFQLASDLALINDPKTLAIVREFARNKKAFFDAFSVAYTKMVSTGTSLK